MKPILSAALSTLIIFSPVSLTLADTAPNSVPVVYHAIIPQDTASSAAATQNQSADATNSSVNAPVSVPVEYHTIVPPDMQTAHTSSATEGNPLLQHLATLFVLNALFANHSNGLLTAGPYASLGNIIILYRLFYQSHAFDN